jgi:hypothetical protein
VRAVVSTDDIAVRPDRAELVSVHCEAHGRLSLTAACRRP